MFRCHFCQQITPPKTTRHTVVIELREKQYSTRRRESKRGGGGGGRGGFRGREEPVHDRGGRGQEISKEVPACPACAAKQHEAKLIEAPVPEVAATPEVVATETATTPVVEAATAATETASSEAAATAVAQESKTE